MKGLTNRGKARCLEGCLFDIVEANYRHVLRHSQAYIMERTNAAYGSNVVERKKRGKVAMMRQQVLYDGIAQFGRCQVLFQLDGQFRTDYQAQVFRHLNNALPASFGIGTIRLPSHE